MKNLLFIFLGVLILVNCEKDKVKNCEPDPNTNPTFSFVELTDCEINWASYLENKELVFLDTMGAEYEFKIGIGEDFVGSRYYKDDSINTLNTKGERVKIYVNFSLSYLTMDLLSQGAMINYLGIKGLRYYIENQRKSTENFNRLELEIWELLDLPGSGSTTLDNLLNTSILECELEESQETNFHMKKTIANKEFLNVYSGVMTRIGLTVYVNNEFGIVGLGKNGKELRIK